MEKKRKAEEKRARRIERKLAASVEPATEEASENSENSDDTPESESSE